MLKKVILLIGATAIVIVAVILNLTIWFPPYDISRFMQLPLNLVVDLKNPEMKIEGIRTGAEQMIRWKDPKKQDLQEIVITYIHGFTGHRSEISPFVEDIQDHFKANGFYARIAGHGIEGKQIRSATVTDWLADIDEIYAFTKQLGKRHIYFGASTGAGMAVLLSEKYDPQSCLILMSPNFGLHSAFAMFGTGPAGFLGLNLFIGNSANDGLVLYPSEEANLVSTKIDGISLNQFLELTKVFRNYNMEKLENPIMVLYSKMDQVIDPEQVEKKFGSIKKNAKNEIYNIGAGHLLFDKDNKTSIEDTKQKVIEFIQKNCI